MIYIKELTVGCQVTLNGKPYKVDEVVPWSIGIEGKESLYYPKDIEPIPITKELLVKNGFVRSPDGVYTEYEKNDLSFVIFDGPVFDGRDRAWILYVYTHYFHSKVQYVHQAQAMCNVLGIELIFEL